MYTFFRNLEDCVVWRGRRRKKGGLLTNIFVVFSVQNPFKVHEKTRCVCRTVRTVSQTWALAFFLDNFDAVSKKEKKRMRLIWSCAPVFSLFYLTSNLWVGLIGPKYVNTTQNEHPVSKEARGYLIFFCSFEARGLLSTNSSLSKNHVLLSISALNFFFALAQNSFFKNHLYLKDYSTHIRSVPRSLPITDNLKFPSFVLEFRNAWNANIYARSSFLPYSKV